MRRTGFLIKVFLPLLALSLLLVWGTTPVFAQRWSRLSEQRCPV